MSHQAPVTKLLGLADNPTYVGRRVTISGGMHVPIIGPITAVTAEGTSLLVSMGHLSLCAPKESMRHWCGPATYRFDEADTTAKILNNGSVVLCSPRYPSFVIDSTGMHTDTPPARP